jgi:tRNA dimethylallyltransferase
MSPIRDKPKIVVITGPTASGKSPLAIELAHEWNGEIVNADSMQVYRGMDVGTAKVPVHERRGIPHHLLDVLTPDSECNAAVYRSLAEPVLQGISSRHKIGFVVGGTGLYIKTLLGGLLQCPPSDHALRDQLHHSCDTQGPHYLHSQLRELDPESAFKIHPNDRVRLIRALEIIHLTRQPLSSLIREHAFRQKAFEALKIGLHVARDALYDRINERSEWMVLHGLIEETQGLLDSGYSKDLKSMKSLGYRHAVQFLEKKWNRDELAQKLQMDTRRYAKRQLTWFKGDPDMVWVDPQDRAHIRRIIEKFM